MPYLFLNLPPRSDTNDLSLPCADPLPPKVVHLSLKDWKDNHRPTKQSKASIFLATTTEAPSFQLDTVHPIIHGQGANNQISDQGVTHDKNGHARDVRLLGPSDIARLRVRSPWPLILIELLSGVHINEAESWIYPFKPIIMYEKQIRKFVELLNEIDADAVEAQNMSSILRRIISEVVRKLGPKKDDVDFSDTYVSNIMQKRKGFERHLLKVIKSQPKEQEDESEDDSKADSGLTRKSSVDQSGTNISKPSNLGPEAGPDSKKISYTCTCLTDARDQLELFLTIIDSNLRSLLDFHKAIRDQTFAKIKFEHLWHLFQPGDLVVTSKQPHQAYRVIHVSGGRPLLTTTDFERSDKAPEAKPVFRRQSQISPFIIDCVRIDFDGESFGPVQEAISILEYEEDRMITALDVYPIHYSEMGKEMTESLLDRGRRFAEYHDFRHKRYEGLSLREPPEEVSHGRQLFMAG